MLCSSLPELCTQIETLIIIDRSVGRYNTAYFLKARAVSINTLVRSLASTLTGIILDSGRLDAMEYWVGLLETDPSAVPRLTSLTLLIDSPFAEADIPDLVSAVAEALEAHAVHSGCPLETLCVRYNPQFPPETCAELEKLRSVKCKFVVLGPVVSNSFGSESRIGALYTDSDFWPDEWA